MKTYVGGKIHGIRVTDKSIEYHGSVSIAAELLEAAQIEQYEQVTIINLNNGQRWTTYAIPAERREFTLNGGGARLGEIGDVCVILTYKQLEKFEGAPVVFCDALNRIVETTRYV
jgi:aspartate 1-decarboxylase